jgi:hypothetical protein
MAEIDDTTAHKPKARKKSRKPIDSTDDDLSGNLQFIQEIKVEA